MSLKIITGTETSRFLKLQHLGSFSLINLCTCFAMGIGLFSSGCKKENQNTESPAPAAAAQKSAPVPIPESKPENVVKKKEKLIRPTIAPEDLDDLYDVSTAANYTLMNSQEQKQWEQKHSVIAVAPTPNKGSTQFIASQQPNRSGPVPQVIVELPPNFSVIPEAGYNRGGYPNKILCEIDQSVMVLVSEGVFIQGKNDATENVAPEHSMFLDSYYIDEHEVTVAAFNTYREYELKLEKRAPQRLSNEQADPQMPALGMAWRDAVGFAKYAGKELPTEAEWEKAARGTNGFDHPWGFGRPAWSRLRKLNQITPVKSYPTDKSPFGVYDTAGNAMEWCADLYRKDAYQKLMKNSNEVPRNWKGPRTAASGSQHVIKGSTSDWFVWHRDGRSLSDRDPRVGFRCVLRLDDSEDEPAKPSP